MEFLPAFFAFLLGYTIGRLDLLHLKFGKSETGLNQSKSSIFSGLKNEKKLLLEIDDSKYVTDVDTSSLEKGYDVIGSVSVANDNINDAANKLSQLKKK